MDKQIKNYLKILETTPENVPAFKALEKIFKEKENWIDLVSLYEKRAEAVTSHVDELFINAATICKEKLEMPDEMERLLLRLLEKQPANEKAGAMLEAYYEESKQTAKIRRLLEERYKVETEPDRKCKAAVKLSALAKSEGDDAAALSFALESLEYKPDDAEALSALRQIRLDMRDFDAAIAVMNKEIGLCGAGETAIKIISDTAKALSEDPFELERAKELYGKVKEMTNGKKKVAAIDAEIKKLDEIKDNYAQIVSQLLEEALNKQNKSEAAEAFLKAAAYTYLYNPKDEQTITDSLSKALLLSPTNIRAINLAERFFTEKKDDQKLLAFYKSVAEKAIDGKLKAYCLAKAGHILKTLGEEQTATDLFLEAFESDPTLDEPFAAVCEILIAKEAYTELARKYEKRVSLAADNAFKVRNLVGLAKLMRDKLRSPLTAQDFFAEAFELDSGCIEAGAALVDSFIAEERFDDAAPVLKNLVENEKDDAKRAVYAATLSGIYLDKLADGQLAFEYAEKSLNLAPKNAETAELLCKTAESCDKFEEAVALLRAATGKIDRDEKAPRRALMLLAATILDRQLSSYDEAEKMYLRILEENENDLESMRLLARLYQKDEKWEHLVNVYEKIVDAAEDEEEKRSLLMEAAQIVEIELSDKRRASGLYARALDKFPEEIEAYKRLEELYFDLAEWEKLADVIRREFAHITSMSEKVSLYFKLGDICEKKLDKLDEAVLSYSEALRFDDNHYQSIEALERLLATSKDTDLIFTALEPYYLRKREFGKLDDGYKSLLAAAKGSPERSALYKKLATLNSEYLYKMDDAYGYMEQALSNNPTDVALLTQMRNLAKEINESQRLVKLLGEQSGVLEDSEIVAKYLLVEAQVYMDELNDPGNAEKSLLKAYAKSPVNQEVLRSVVEFYRFVENWESFAQYAEKAVLLQTDAAERTKLSLEMAVCYRGQLNKLDAAIAILETLLASDVSIAEARGMLRRFYREAADFDKLTAHLKRELEIVKSDDEIVDVKLELAQIYNDVYGDAKTACAVYGEVVALNSRQETAILGLEKMLSVAEAKHEAAGYLAPIYERHGEFEKLVTALSVLFETDESGDKKREYAEKLSNITLIELNRKNDAFQWILKAYLYSPAVEPGSNMETLSVDTGDFESYLATLDEKKKTVDDLKKLEVIVLKQSQIAYEELREFERALGYLKDFLESDDASIPVMEAAERVYERQENYEALYLLWERKVSKLEERSARRELKLRMASLLRTQLNDLPAARNILEDLLKERDNDVEVIERLEIVLSGVGDFKALLELYRHKMGLIKEDSETVPLRIKIGELHEEKLGEPEEAQKVYIGVIRNYYESELAQKLVDRLLGQENMQLAAADEIELKLTKDKNWEKLVSVHEIQLKHNKDKDAKQKLLSKLSAIYQEKLKDPVKAFEGFARVFVEDPFNDGALFEIEKLASELAYWKELAAVYDQAADRTGDARERARDLLLKAAQLYEEILALQDEAIKTYRKALNHDPVNMTAIKSLEALCRKAELWSELVDIYKQRVNLAADNSEKIELYWYICDIYENPSQLNDKIAAIPYFEALFELDETSQKVQNTLCELYDQTESWEKKALVFEKQIKLSADIDAKVDKMMELARLFENKLQRYPSAIEWFKSVIGLDETHEEAFKALETYLALDEYQKDLAYFMAPLYLNKELWTDYIRTLEYQVNFAEEDEVKGNLLVTISGVYEKRLENQRSAFDAYARALRRMPGSEFIQDELLRLAVALVRFDDLAALYEEEIVKAEAAEENEARNELIIALCLRAAALYEEYIKDNDKATAKLQALIKIDPKRREALNRQERIYNVGHKWYELIETLKLKLAISTGLDETKDLNFRIANIYEEELSRNDMAIATYREMLALDERDRDILHSLARLCRTEQMWQDLIGVFEHELRILSPEEHPWGIKAQMAQIKWQKLNLVAEAQELLKEITTYAPDHIEARELLELMLAAEDCELGASLILAPLFEAEGEFDRLVEMLNVQIRRNEDKRIKRGLNERIANIYEQEKMDAASAFGYWKAAIAAEPHDDGLAEKLAKSAIELEKWDDLVLHYISILPSVESGDELLYKYRVRIGDIYLNKLASSADAEQFYRKALDQRPDELHLVETLEYIYEELEDYKPLVEMLYRKADLLREVVEKLPVYFRAAKTQEEKLGDVEGAISTYNLILSLQPTNFNALAELDRLYQRREDWTNLESVLERLANLAEALRQKLDYVYRRAQVWQFKLSDVNRAIDLYSGILDKDREYENAYASLTDLCGDAAHQDKAIGVLKPIYEEADRWDRIVDIYERKLATMTDREARIELLTEIKEIHELRLEDKTSAFKSARRLYLEDISNPISWAELERLAVDTGGYDGLVETYLEIIDAIEDVEQRIELLMHVGSICEDKLNDSQKAIEQYRKALSLDDKKLDCVDKLDKLYEKESLWAELSNIINHRIGLIADKRVIQSEKLRLASIWEKKLEDKEAAIGIFEDILSEAPDNIEALEALQRLYEELERWEQLVQILRAEVRIARGDAKKASLYAQMGDVLFLKLGQPQDALAIYNRVLQFDENNVSVVSRLESLYENMALWDQLVVHLQKQLRRAKTTEEKVACNKKLASVYRSRLNMEDKAVTLYHKVLEIAADDMEAVGELESIYIANKAWSKLAELLNQLQYKVDDVKRRQLNVRLASLYFQYVKDEQRAIEYARKALDNNPQLDELNRLEEIFRDSTHNEIYGEIITKQIAVTEEPKQKIYLLFRLADLSLLHNDKPKAIECFERALEIEPNNLQAAENLETLYIDAQRWDRLAVIYEAMLREYTEGEERLNTLLKLADCYLHRLHDVANAFDVYSVALSENPYRYELIDVSEDLARQCNKVEQLVTVYKDIADIVPDKSRQKALCYKIASISERDLRDMEAAAAYYTQYIEFGEYDERAVEFLIEYNRAKMRYNELIAIYELKLAKANVKDKVDIYLKIGEIFRDNLNEFDKAIGAFRKAHDYDDANMTTIDILVDLLKFVEDFQGYVDMLKQKLHLTSDHEGQEKIRLELAVTYEKTFNDAKNAKVYYRAIIADNANHIESLDALERIYEAEENWDELLETLSRKVAVHKNPELRIEIYFKMAGIWETRFDQLEMAIQYLEKILQIDESNVKAIGELERIYKHIGDFQNLIEAYKRHIAQIAEAEDIVKLYCEIGRIYYESLSDPGEAIKYLNKALSIDNENFYVLDTLSNLYIKGEKWDKTIETYQKMVSLTEDKAVRTDYIMRIAEIFKDKLNNVKAAEGQLKALFNEDEDYVPAIRALRRFYRSINRWEDFLIMAEHEKDRITDKKDMALLLHEEALYYKEQKKDVAKAITLLKQALGYNNLFGDAIKELAALSFDNQIWQDAWNFLNASLPYYDQDDENESKELAKVFYKLGRVAEKMGNMEIALKHYNESFKRDSDSLECLESLSDAYYAKEDWEQAFRFYQTILVRFRANKTTEQLVGLFCRLGEINGKIQKHEIAVRMYEKALEIDPNSVIALSESVKYYESLERWAKVIKYRVTLAKLLTKEESFGQWVAIGDIYAERLKQKREGLEAYKRAMMVKTDDANLLSRVADILLELEKYPDAIAAYRKLLAVETDQSRKYALNIKIGDLYREHTEEPALAATFYNSALDIDPSDESVFDRLETFLISRNLLEELDSAYRQQIARLATERSDDKINLWRKLSILLVSKLGKVDEGIRAYEIIVGMKPGDLKHKLALAELYARDPHYYDKALAIHEGILAENIYNPEAHQALFDLNFNLSRFDKAFLHASVLDYLGGGEKKAKEFYSQHSKERSTEPLDYIDRKEWFSYVVHHDGQNMAGQALAILYHHVESFASRDIKTLGVKKKDRQDLADSLSICNHINQVLRTMGAPEPEVYVKGGVVDRIDVGDVYPATLLIPDDMFSGHSKSETLFHIGRAAAIARPDFIMAHLYPPDELHQILEAAMTMINPKLPVRNDPKKVAERRKQIEKGLSKKHRPMLEQYIAEFIETLDSFDFNRWYASVYYTANRTGLIVSNDFKTAMKWVEIYSQGQNDAWIEAQKKDLLMFWISEGYAYLRAKKLGFAIS